MQIYGMSVVFTTNSCYCLSSVCAVTPAVFVITYENAIVNMQVHNWNSDLVV
jgi:hypothetical protein